MPATMTREPALQTRRRTSAGDTIIELTGKLDSSLSTELREEAITLVQPGCRLVLDLTGLEDISPTGIRILLMFYRRVRAEGGTISITGASPKVFEVAEAAGYCPCFRKRRRPYRSSLEQRSAESTPTRPKPSPASPCPGTPTPFGATLVSGGVNFAVYSRCATACTLVLFESGAKKPFAEIPFPAAFRVGNVFAMTVFDLDVDHIEYGYRMEGPFEPVAGHRFDPTKVLLDPMARTVCGREVWGVCPDASEAVPLSRPHHARGLRLGRRRTTAPSPRESCDLRNARPRFHAEPHIGRAASGHFRRPAKNSVLEGARRQLCRVAPDLRVRRDRKRPYQPAHRRAAVQLLGVQHGRLLRPQRQLRRHGALRLSGRRVQIAHQGAAS